MGAGPAALAGKSAERCGRDLRTMGCAAAGRADRPVVFDRYSHRTRHFLVELAGLAGSRGAKSWLASVAGDAGAEAARDRWVRAVARLGADHLRPTDEGGRVDQPPGDGPHGQPAPPERKTLRRGSMGRPVQG